jgi:hypothetical protein
MKEVTIEVRRKANERSGYQMSQAHTTKATGSEKKKHPELTPEGARDYRIPGEGYGPQGTTGWRR